MSEQNKFDAYESHFTNGTFVLKALLTFLGGGLLACTAFFSDIITNSAQISQSDSLDINAIIFWVKCSYVSFLTALGFALAATLCFYFANRWALLNKGNICLVCSSVILGLISFALLFAGLIFLYPMFNGINLK